uniref:Uncharacterized protein n=1 Tax=Anguilla anguilla TaxID=7936 RepID=A0A0E9RZ96_ANGAN
MFVSPPSTVQDLCAAIQGRNCLPPLFPQYCRQTMWTAHFCGLCHKLLSLLLHPHKKRF